MKKEEALCELLRGQSIYTRQLIDKAYEAGLKAGMNEAEEVQKAYDRGIEDGCRLSARIIMTKTILAICKETELTGEQISKVVKTVNDMLTEDMTDQAVNEVNKADLLEKMHLQVEQ